MTTCASARPYAMQHPAFMLRDAPEHIDFHVKNGDYFKYIATAIGFFEEKLANSTTAAREYALAKELRDDLRYVNEKYAITPKESLAFN